LAQVELTAYETPAGVACGVTAANVTVPFCAYTRSAIALYRTRTSKVKRCYWRNLQRPDERVTGAPVVHVGLAVAVLVGASVVVGSARMVGAR